AYAVSRSGSRRAASQRRLALDASVLLRGSRSASIGRLSTLGRSADPLGIQSLVGILHENPHSLCLEVAESVQGQRWWCRNRLVQPVSLQLRKNCRPPQSVVKCQQRKCLVKTGI